MRCPNCGTDGKHRVLDTTQELEGIRRRRVCETCGYRFNTMETLIAQMPLLIKADGTRQEYSREKLLRGIRIACAKRPVAAIDIDRLVDNIEYQLLHLNKLEVPSRIVGDMVIMGLKELDAIAYIRYAIVYLGLDSLESVRDEIDHLLEEEAQMAVDEAESSFAESSADEEPNPTDIVG
ncbi:MAG: transcriptional repressor NrdR [Phototrophicales bacterium]|nr:MAG: transcriptional repressor NrdR [Phototrophicales bacterium]